MGNERNRLRTRFGIIRPGPEGRSAAAARAEVKRAAAAEASRLRMRAYRARLAEDATTVERNRRSGEGSMESSGFGERLTSRKSNKLARAIIEELEACQTQCDKSSIMEKVLNHDSVWPHLPDYYPRPSEAKSIFTFLRSFRNELQSVKTAHSKEFLARKGVLLDAAVREGIEGTRVLGRVLQVRPCSFFS